jgi:O-acetyl-ADP-ribose deacetylase
MDQPESAQRFLNGRVFVQVGDITTQRVDAIVNAANHTLLGGGGVDGAIHEAGGPEILAACEALRRSRYPDGLPTGQAVMTTGGRLSSPYVIHTVGPIKGVHGERDSLLLRLCYVNSLALAVEYGLRSVAFPSISTGAYGYPRDEAAQISSESIAGFLAREKSLAEVRLVFFSESDRTLFLKHARFRI